MKQFKKFSLVCLFILVSKFTAMAQVTGAFWVKGDTSKFYPVTFADGGWTSNVATELEIGRSNVHNDSWWRGSVIAKFRYHVTSWGNGSNFIDADIRQYSNVANLNKMIAGWRDGTGANSSARIIIWMRGNTSYNYNANYAVSPVIYDGEQQLLPYQEIGGPAHSFKTAVDSSVNVYGSTYNSSAYFIGGGTNYMAGKLAIGTFNPGNYKLAVEGTIGARRVKVTQGSWADFVFYPDYKLPSLEEVEQFVKTNQHLPEIPSAKEVEKEGLDVGEMNKKLLQKIEELTLYIIEIRKESTAQRAELEMLKKEIKKKD
ncbi:hypothetical protein [Chitinophaga sp.]|uniref:hypothetical protein n=1 Tax=Chitinophaga sp. TaxID=1869181 RepID=UPI002F93D247